MTIDWSLMRDAKTLRAGRLARCRETALAQLTEAAGRALGDAATGVPLTEQLGWATKEQAARAFLAGQADPVQTRLLEIEAEAMGEAPEVLAQKVMDHAADHAAKLARLTGQRRRIALAIAGADDEAGIDACLELGLQALGGNSLSVVPAAGQTPERGPSRRVRPPKAAKE